MVKRIFFKNFFIFINPQDYKFNGASYEKVSVFEKPGACAEQISSGPTAAPPLGSENSRQLNQKGISLIQNDQFRDAVVVLTLARQLAPQDVEVLGNFGYALLMNGEAIEAENVLRNALALKPNRGATLNNLGLALAAQGKESEAKDLFVRYVAASSKKKLALKQLEAWATSPDASSALRNAARSALLATK